MKLTVEITEDQRWVLNQQFLQYSFPYGTKIKHIAYVNSMTSYLNKEDLSKFIEIRNQLSELGILHFIHMDNGTLRFYELTKIGQMFYSEVNKKS